jgi:hypothetical protein
MNPIQLQHLLDHPDQLEDLYRTQPAAFRKAMASLDPDSLSHPVVLTWKARLEYGQRDATWGTRREWIAVLMLSLVAGLLAKLPDFLPLDAERYYPRNLSFIAMAMLSVYFAWKHTLPLLHWMGLAAVLGLSAVYINLLPGGDDSDTLILACLHMPLILWATAGLELHRQRMAHSRTATGVHALPRRPGRHGRGADDCRRHTLRGDRGTL